jgi:hypothetical protein
MAKKLTPPDVYGALIQSTTLKIKRLLPGLHQAAQTATARLR